MEFESTVGDLSSIVNVEKRRAAAIKNDVSQRLYVYHYV